MTDQMHILLLKMNQILKLSQLLTLIFLFDDVHVVLEGEKLGPPPIFLEGQLVNCAYLLSEDIEVRFGQGLGFQSY